MKHAYAFGKSSLLTLLLVLSIMVACKDDKDPDPQTPDDNPIVGTWQLTGITPETAGTSIPALDFIKTLAPCYLDLKLTFKSDNSISAADCASAVSTIDPIVPISQAKWKVEGDQLTLSRGTTNQSFKFTQTSTELKVVVNTNTDTTKPAVNAVLAFKRV